MKLNIRYHLLIMYDTQWRIQEFFLVGARKYYFTIDENIFLDEI
jgi:hypothetical protein